MGPKVDEVGPKMATWRPFFRACVAMIELQSHWGERFGGTFLDDLSLRRACRATGESVLEEFLCLWWLLR